jgi:hypothetical protein
MSAFPRPASLAADTLAAAALGVRDEVRSAWGTAAAWEVETRELWLRLCDFPWRSTALRLRAEHLAREGALMVEGPASALFRAARVQRVPWMLEERPLRDLGERARAFHAAARDALDLAAEQERTAVRLARAQERWRDFPQAWARWTGLLDLDEVEVFAGASAGELENVTKRMERLEEEMERWRGEVERWLARGGEAGPLGVSEARYLALLNIGAADRRRALDQSAARVRQGTRAQLTALPPPARPGWPALVRALALQWADRPAPEPLSAEEVACYRAALAQAYAAAEPPAPAGHE